MAQTTRHIIPRAFLLRQAAEPSGRWAESFCPFVGRAVLTTHPCSTRRGNRQVGRLAMPRMMTNKPKFRWAYARLLGFVLKESLRPCFVMQFKANCSLCYLLFTIFFIPLHGKNSFYSKNGKERFTIPSNRTILRYCG